MNNPHQLLLCLALSFALSVAALEAWERGVVTIDSHAVLKCFNNGNDRYAYGTKVSINIRDTSIVWLQCKSNTGKH